MNTTARLIGSLALCCAPLCAALAQVPAYPAKPIRWIIPYPPAGGTDYNSRAVAQAVSARLGQPIVMDNKPGAAGAIGMEAAARSAPDGYTLVTGESGSLTLNPSLYKKLSYNPTKDFQPISLFIRNPFLLVVNPAIVPVRDIGEFFTYVRERPAKVDYASFGAGSISHIMTELLKARANINITHVPYKGAAPALQDLLGGQIGVMMMDYTTAQPHLASGKLRALAATSRVRHPLLPRVPTLEESGVADYDVYSWMGVMAPAGTPKAIVERLRKEVADALSDPAVTGPFSERGILPYASTPEQYARQIETETARWAVIIESLRLQLD